MMDATISKDGVSWRFEFSRGGITVKKNAIVREDPKQNMLNFCKAAKEADRDIAYELHGEAWREHCEFNKGWFGQDPDLKSLFDKAKHV